MKEVVVVTATHGSVWFTGNQLNVINNADGYLIVKDEEDAIAVFNRTEWIFWREPTVEDITEKRK